MNEILKKAIEIQDIDFKNYILIKKLEDFLKKYSNEKEMYVINIFFDSKNFWDEEIIEHEILNNIDGKLHYSIFYILDYKLNIAYQYISEKNKKIENSIIKYNEYLEEKTEEKMKEKAFSILEENAKEIENIENITNEIYNYIINDYNILTEYLCYKNKKLKMLFINKYLLRNKKEFGIDKELIVDLLTIKIQNYEIDLIKNK